MYEDLKCSDYMFVFVDHGSVFVDHGSFKFICNEEPSQAGKFIKG